MLNSKRAKCSIIFGKHYFNISLIYLVYPCCRTYDEYDITIKCNPVIKNEI